MTDQLIREGEVRFAKPLPRALLRDVRLTWGARALFAFLWDLPTGWRPTAAHLATMGPDGRDAIRARLRELEAVGALRLERIPGTAGKLAGTRWVLRAAELWAREAALSPSNGTAERRACRQPDFPTLGGDDAKVHQCEGSPTEGSPTTGGGGELPEAWRKALELEIATAAPVRNPVGLRRTILARYRANGGPDAEILAELAQRDDAARKRTERERAQAEHLARIQCEADAAAADGRPAAKLAAIRRGEQEAAA